MNKLFNINIDLPKVIISFFGCIVTYLFGSVDDLIMALLVLVAVDFITGILCAICIKTLNSNKGWNGIIKKVGTFAIVCIATIIDKNANLNGTLRDLVLWFYIATEAISILENFGRIGVPLPKKLLAMLEQLKDK